MVSTSGFPARLRAARLNAGLSQRQLALECDLSRATVLRLEQGKHAPQWKTVQRLAKRLGVQARTLLIASSHILRDRRGP